MELKTVLSIAGSDPERWCGDSGDLRLWRLTGCMA